MFGIFKHAQNVLRTITFGLLLLIWQANAHACGCCLQGPVFQIDKGLHHDYYSHYLEAVTGVELPVFRLHEQLGVAESEGFAFSAPKVSVKFESLKNDVGTNRVAKGASIKKAPYVWMIALTEVVKNKRHSLLLRFIAPSSDQWMMVRSSTPPSNKTLNNPQLLDYVFEIPGKLDVVSDPGKLLKSVGTINGSLVMRGTGSLCDSVIKSVALSLIFLAKQKTDGNLAFMVGEGLLD